MRAFVLMILVLNLVLFAWYYFGGESQLSEFAPPPRPLEPSVSTLVLVEETPLAKPQVAGRSAEVVQQKPAVAERAPVEVVEALAPQPEPAAAVENEEKAPPPKIARCYKVGPFEKREQPAELVELVERYGFDAAITAKEVERLFGNWIYLTEYDTIQSARADMKALKEQGIKDVAIARLDDGQLIISLGIYGQQQSLKRRLSELKKLGYVNYQTKKRYRKGEAFWLVLSGFEGAQQQIMVDELGVVLSERSPAAKLTTVGCS